MCNAYNHEDGCRCGFGPPYDDVKVEVLRVSASTPRVADLKIAIPTADRIQLRRLDARGKQKVTHSVQRKLQELADKRFGKGAVKVRIGSVRPGSITFYVVLVAAYKFFKNYKGLRDGVKAFCEDVWKASRYLKSRVRGAFLKAERDARKDVPAGRHFERKGI